MSVLCWKSGTEETEVVATILMHLPRELRIDRAKKQALMCRRRMYQGDHHNHVDGRMCLPTHQAGPQLPKSFWL